LRDVVDNAGVGEWPPPQIRLVSLRIEDGKFKQATVVARDIPDAVTWLIITWCRVRGVLADIAVGSSSLRGDRSPAVTVFSLERCPRR